MALETLTWGVREGEGVFLNKHFFVYILEADQTFWNAKNKMACAPSEDSDQPGHSLSLIRVFPVRKKKPLVLSYPLSAQGRLIRLGGCLGWSESLLGAQVILLVCRDVAHLILQNYEPGHSKTYKNCMWVQWHRDKPDQPAHVHSLINVLSETFILYVDLFITSLEGNELKRKRKNTTLLISSYIVWDHQTLICALNSHFVETLDYHKFPKYSDTQKICCDHPKSWTRWHFVRVMYPKDAEGIANSVDPDQTTPLGAVRSRSALFAQTCLSENLGKLRYVH